MPEYDALADLYDLEYAHDYDLPFWLALAEREGGPVVEWGAGTGRLSVPLTAAGFDVTAVEASVAMIEQGRRKGGTVEWVHGDMRNVGLGKRYRLGVCAFNSFLCLQSQEDALAFLGNAREHLEPGGLLGIEVSAFSPEELSDTPGDPSLRHDFAHELPGGGTLARLSFSYYEAATQLLSMRLFYELYDREGKLENKRMHKLSIRVLGRGELELMLQLAGFETEAIYGGFEGEPFGGESERMISLARPL